MKKAWIWVILVVLALIIGIVLYSFLFPRWAEPLKMTDDQIKAIVMLYGEQKKVEVYPDSKMIEVPLGKSGRFVLGIRNNEDRSLNFSYEIVIVDNKSEKDCATSKQDLMNIINSGSSRSNIIIGTNASYVANVSFSPGYGDPICNVRYRINVYANDEPYASDYMDVNFKL